MLKNYLRTAWRNIWRNKVFSLINIIGLSIGISASLVIYCIISYDFSFDDHHKDGDRIYRVVTNSVNAGIVSYNGGVTYPLAEGIRKDLPGLDLVSPIFTWFPAKVSVPINGKERPLVFKQQKHIVFTDENYFRMIHYQWLAGSPNISLSQPYQVVLTESSANLYFPNLSMEDVIGRKLYFGDTLGTTITGIVKDLPYNTDFTFKLFISRSTFGKTTLNPVSLTDWGSVIGLSQLFIKLDPGVHPEKLEKEIATLIKKHGINSDDKSQSQTIYKLQPLSDLHFNHLYGNIFGYDEIAHKPTIYGLLAIAVLILVLACMNFVNLTTAQSTRRAKEIGIRKTIGSSKSQLVIQFLSETFVLTMIATLLSVLITPFLLKRFAGFLPQGLHFGIGSLPAVLGFGGFLVIVVGLLSGLYPALVLSSYRPVLVLNDHTNNYGESRSALLRKMLTISQFVIAQVFVIATLLVSKQISFVLNKDLGFKKDAIVYFYTSFYDTTRQHKLLLLEKLKTIPGISLTSLSGDAPFSTHGWTEEIKYNDGKKSIETELDMKYVDTSYCRLYQIKLLAGRTLPYSDTIKDLLINETYAHILGFQDLREAIGKSVELNGNKKTIVGVVADFHQASLHNPIKPLMIASQLSNEGFISVSLGAQKPGDNSWKAILTKMQKAWTSVYPDDDFNYKFQDEEIAKSYKSEQEMATLLNWATGISVFISFLGLLGLVIHSTNQRIKEIGIRKVIGASVAQIIVLLSADLLKLIGWAFLIAAPIAWWGAHAWLNNFTYRTNLDIWIFVSTGLIIGTISFIILVLQTYKAASTNPVECLRNE
jgi:putative ABC transport system permease protein